MKLGEWLDEQELTPADAAKDTGVGINTIYRVLSGDHNITMDNAKKLWLYTRKKVSLEELLPGEGCRGPK